MNKGDSSWGWLPNWAEFPIGNYLGSGGLVYLWK